MNFTIIPDLSSRYIFENEKKISYRFLKKILFEEVSNDTKKTHDFFNTNGLVVFGK